MNIEALADQFCNFYYATFDTARQNLGAVYQAGSMLTHIDTKLQGIESIVNHLINLKFQTVAHSILSKDVQPTPFNGILVFVTGKMTIDGGNPLLYSEVFHLLPVNNDPNSGSYYIQNQVFKLNYG